MSGGETGIKHRNLDKLEESDSAKGSCWERKQCVRIQSTLVATADGVVQKGPSEEMTFQPRSVCQEEPLVSSLW